MDNTVFSINLIASKYEPNITNSDSIPILFDNSGNHGLSLLQRAGLNGISTGLLHTLSKRSLLATPLQLPKALKGTGGNLVKVTHSVKITTFKFKIPLLC